MSLKELGTAEDSQISNENSSSLRYALQNDKSRLCEPIPPSMLGSTGSAGAPVADPLLMGGSMAVDKTVDSLNDDCSVSQKLEIDHRIQDIITTFPSITIERGHTAQSRVAMRLQKYNIDINDLDLQLYEDEPKPDVARVEKKIRMRIRYTCHLCQTGLGRDLRCRTCDHQQCSRCPRDPPKRLEMDASPLRETHSRTERSSGLDLTDFDIDLVGRNRLLRGISNGQPHACDRQIQYQCHECATDFVIGTAWFCPNCGHRRCGDCPGKLTEPVASRRDADLLMTFHAQQIARLHRDRVWRKPRMRVRWSCHECQTTFASGQRTCSGCAHPRCNLCTRDPPVTPRASEISADARL